MFKIIPAALAVCCSILQLVAAESDWRKEMPIANERQLPRSGRTHVISQAQLKYGLKPYDSYFDRWVDYPLFVNPELKDDATHRALLHFPDYAAIQKTAESYGLDGFAMFPNYFPFEQAKGVLDYNVRLGNRDFGMIQLIHPAGDEFQFYADEAVKNPGAFKLDGKIVMPLFGGGDVQLAKRDYLQKKYGDKFLFFAYFNINALHPDFYFPQFGYREKRMSPEYAKLFMDKIREFLRKYDGILLEDAWAMNLDHGMREPYWEFYNDFVLRAVKKVYSEPEFKDKYLWMSAFVGHENPSFLGYHVSSNGTANLRKLMEAAIDAKADIINIGEWDEQNENTSLRPTIYNSTSHLRIMRYYTAQQKNQPLTPLPGDDLTLPNLVLSVRKVLSMGERIVVELLNIPDGGEQRQYEVELILEDLRSGKEVFRSSVLPFDSTTMQEHRIALPSENFAQSRALLPKLKVKMPGQPARELAQGFQPIDLRPVWNWDYKWAKQPIRDIAWDLQGQLKALDGADSKEQRFQFSAQAPEEIAQSELFDNQLVVYSHSRPGTTLCRETPEQLVFRVSLLGVQEKDNYANFTFSLDKGDLQAMTRSRMWRDDVHQAVQEQNGQVVCSGLAARWIAPVFFLATPRANLDSTLKIDFKEGQSFSIKLRDLVDQQIYGMSLPKGVSLVLSRYLQQWDHPAQLNTTTVDYTVNTLPDMPDSLIWAQVVTKSGKLWRSRPIEVRKNDNGQTKVATVYSETRSKAIPLRVPSYRVADLDYTPEERYGSVLVTPAGRMLWGMRGGFIQQAMGRGGCENDCYGTVFSDGATCKYYPVNSGSPAPELFMDRGVLAMKFNGKNSFLSLPQGVLPRRAGFELNMKIRPDSVTQKQFLLGNTNALYGGGLYLLELLADNTFHGEFVNHNLEILSADNASVFNAPARLKPGVWNDLKIIYNLKTIRFIINGNPAVQFPCPGPARFDTSTVIGGFQSFFAGDIKDLVVKHAK